jgi:WD40 repeat protein
MRLTSLFLGLLFCSPIANLAWCAQPAKTTSELITEGIGRRYLPAGGPLAFSAWPLPLQQVTRATMASTISHDGRLVVIASGHPSSGGYLTVWDVESKKPILIKPANRGIRRVQFVPNTELVVVAGFDSKARLMDARTGRHIREFSRHTDGINGIAISVDGTRLATGGHDDEVMLWNLQTGQHLRTFRGHTDDVLAVALVPTEPLLISSGRDRRLLIWNIETGELVRELTGPENWVEDIVVSNSGKVIAAASADGKTWLWDRESGNLLGTLPSKGGRLASVAFSPQGDVLAMGGYDGEVSIWDYAQRSPIAKVAHGGAVYAITFQEDGSHFLSHSWSGDGKLWKADGTLVAEFPIQSAGEKTVTAVAWAPDESCVAVLNQVGGIRLIDVSLNQEIGSFRMTEAPATCIAFATDGQLITGHADGAIRKVSRDGGVSDPIVRAASGVTSLEIPSPGAIAATFQNGTAGRLDLAAAKLAMRGDHTDVVQLAAANGLDWFATLHKAGDIRFWDAKTGAKLTGQLNPDGESARGIAVSAAGSRLLCAVLAGTVRYRINRVDNDVTWETSPLIPVPNGPLMSLEISPDGRTAVGGLGDGTIRVLGTDGVTGATFKKDSEAGNAIGFAFGPRSQRLISVSDTGQGWLWDVDVANSELLPLASMSSHEKGARFVSFAMNDKSLVTEGYDNKAFLWDLTTGERRFLKARDSSSACAVSPDSLKIAVGQFPGRLDLRDLATLQTEREFAGVPRGAYSLSFSHDQSRLVATFYDKDLIVYDVSSPAPAYSLGPAPLPWTYATFSPDGTTFVSCTGDYKQQNAAGSIRLHEAATGKVLKSFEGHNGEVKYAAFDREGKRLATTSSDKTIRIYDVAAGTQLAMLKQPDTAFCAQFIPDSDLLITGDYRGFLRIWDLRTNTLAQPLRAHADWIQRLVFSRDLTVLATAGRDGSVKLWKIGGTGNLLRIFGSSP